MKIGRLQLPGAQGLAQGAVLFAQAGELLTLGGRQAVASVRHEQDEIGLLDGELRLLAHLDEDFRLSGRLESAGVDEREGPAVPRSHELTMSNSTVLGFDLFSGNGAFIPSSMRFGAGPAWVTAGLAPLYHDD